jgi:hypothetical protein
MALYGVRARDGAEVTVVAARTRLAARLRVAELRAVPASTLLAEPEPAPPSRVYRCGEVGLVVIWSARCGQWHVGTTCWGERRHVTIGRASGDPPDGLEAMRGAARAAVAFLLDADDLDEAAVLWERVARCEPRPRVVEEKGAGR